MYVYHQDFIHFPHKTANEYYARSSEVLRNNLHKTWGVSDVDPKTNQRNFQNISISII